MPLSPEIQKEILEAAREGKYEDAADLLVGSSKEETSYEAVLDLFKKVGPSVNQGTISNIYKIYTENSNNIPGLKEKLGNLVSSHNVNAGAEESRSTDFENIEEKKIPDAIAFLRKRQKEEILKSGKPNEQIAKQINTLIKRQLSFSRQGNGEKINPTNKSSLGEAKSYGPPKAGARNWFVLPDATKTEEEIKVVTGSPIIQELRRRYEQKYSRVRDDIRKQTKEMSVEAQFDRKKELDRERVFIESYKDSSAVEDQDIYVHQIATSFTTDQYFAVTSVVDLEDKGKKYYNFDGGRLVSSYNMETKKYTLSVDGEILGAFSVLLPRKTDSGRIIDEAYDVVEYRDGIPAMYSHSSKGNLSIRNIDDITRSVNQSKIDLVIPMSSVIGDSKKKSKQDAVEISETVQPEKSPEKPAIMQKPQKEADIHDPPSSFAPPEESVAAPEPDSNAGYLRSQLQSFQGKPTSETTMRYIAGQLAEAEGKKLEDICKEFGISVPNAKKSKEPEAAEPPKVKEKKHKEKEGDSIEIETQVETQVETQPVVLESEGAPEDLESRVTRLEKKVHEISSVIEGKEPPAQKKVKEKKSKIKPKEKESPLKDTVKKLLSQKKANPKKHEEKDLDESNMKEIKERLSRAFDSKEESTSLEPLTEQEHKRKR